MKKELDTVLAMFRSDSHITHVPHVNACVWLAAHYLADVVPVVSLSYAARVTKGNEYRATCNFVAALAEKLR